MKRFLVNTGIVVVFGLAAAKLLLPTGFAQNTSAQVTSADSEIESSLSVATFAGGCFWCVEALFETVPGVSQVISGYSGGQENSPNYRQVSSGATGHTEAVQIYYDESLITYEGLLETLWRTANPTDNGGQYADRGRQYRPEIFYHNEQQQRAAMRSRQNLIDSDRYDKPVVIGITPFSNFYPAEDYHQDYYKKNPVRYKFYTSNSGRYQFIDSVWPEGRAINYADYRPDNTSEQDVSSELSSMTQSAAGGGSIAPFSASSFVKPSDSELRETLSRLQYNVTQKDGTERPFDNPLHDEKRMGLYVDIVSGEPLFSSSDKFDSKTGWPSFIRPIAEGSVVEKIDRSLFSVRTEIRSALADSHLGHVFNDGPPPTGNRYCMNSAALRFIPLEQMEKLGYGAYIKRVSGANVSTEQAVL